MNTRTNTYRTVEKLPDRAMPVSAFAVNQGIGSPQVYKRWKRHVKDGKEISFEIVIFKGYNFVIPDRAIKQKSPV